MKPITRIFALVISALLLGSVLFAQNGVALLRPVVVSPDTTKTVRPSSRRASAKAKDTVTSKQPKQPTESKAKAAAEKMDSLKRAAEAQKRREELNQARRIAEEKKDEKPVDIKSKRMFSVPVGDSLGTALVGDVILFHNGAVITCDSVVRYSDKQMSCFGKVVINKDDTYIYGDRAEYDGYINEAQVFSPLIKVVDNDATLYTYNFKFNTLDNIGEYYGTGTLHQKGNKMESERGYYMSSDRVVTGVGKVEMQDSTYMLGSDSVSYNMDTEVATFYTKADIWNNKGEYLTADQGDYLRGEDRYLFRSDGYILTDTREIWADSIDYRAAKEDVEMRHNVQVRDDENKSVVFSHYGHYLEDGDVVLTRRPAVMSWNSEEGDTVYMRSDTINLFLVDSLGFYKLNRPSADSLAAQKLADSLAANNSVDSLSTAKSADSLAVVASGAPLLGADSLSVGAATDSLSVGKTDSLAVVTAADSLVAGKVEAAAVDSLAQPTATTDSLPKRTLMGGDEMVVPPPGMGDRPRQTGEIDKTEALNIGEEGSDQEVVKQPNEELQPNAKTDSITTKAPTKAEQRAARKAKKESERKAREEQKRLERNKKSGAAVTDSLTVGAKADTMTVNSDSTAVSSLTDSLSKGAFAADSLAVGTDSLAVAAADSVAAKDKQADRVLQAYRNVKIYRKDFQAVCDSLMGFTVDSTAQMHLNPILWNELNQITGERVDIETQNQKPRKAVFTGMPIMSSEVDTMRYNQVEGATITALFDDGVMYRTDVDGNARTFYFMVDDKDQTVNGFMTIQSSDISFFIEDNTVVTMTYRGSPEYVIYKADDIPVDVAQRLPNFKWYIDKKPTIEQILDSHQLRPSEREAASNVKQPQFDKTRAIESYREALLKGGKWADRDDKITQETRDFIDSRQGEDQNAE